MARGKFITLEGGEGAGKSTQVERLRAALDSAGVATLATREPGGSPGAEAVRELLVTGEPDRWDSMTEALLHFAARRDHVVTVIEPALADGIWVISDRFADSTRAYQGIAGGLNDDAIDTLYRLAIGNLVPDLTLVLDLSAADGLARAAVRGGGEDRYERMGAAYHQRLREAFLSIAKNDPERCRVIDAAAEADDVEARIFEIVAAEFGLAR